MKNTIRFNTAWLVLAIIHGIQCSNDNSGHYRGKQYSDSVYTTGIQTLPGKVQCEYYDLGGAGIAYYDADSINLGSGALNPADGTYLNEFRKNEGVDISYTKIDERGIDNNPYNRVEPRKDQLYIGWTEPGEWLKYTIRVRQTGIYKVGLMYTSNRSGKISLAIDDQNVTGSIDIPSTNVKEEIINWRQWHHWNYIDDVAEIKLRQGVHILTLITVAEGNMNYDFLNFSLK